MFWSKNKKKVYPCIPQFNYIKVGCKGVFVTRTSFRDGLDTDIVFQRILCLKSVFVEKRAFFQLQHRFKNLSFFLGDNSLYIKVDVKATE